MREWLMKDVKGYLAKVDELVATEKAAEKEPERVGEAPIVDAGTGRMLGLLERRLVATGCRVRRHRRRGTSDVHYGSRKSRPSR